MFRVGDIVRSADKVPTQYNVTNSKMICAEVVDVNGHNKILIRVLEHERDWEVGCEFWVDSKYFVPVNKVAPLDEEEFISLFD